MLLVRSNHRNFPLKEVESPNLFRDFFPYEKICRTYFDNKIIPPTPPKEIFITDTTFRDGQQSRPPYTVKQIKDLFEMLHRLGGKSGVIRQSEFFLYSKRDRAAVEECRSFGFKYPEITGWIRAKKEDLELVKQMELKETGILTSVSDYHIFLKLKKDRKKAMQDYLEIVSFALEAGIIPRCHFEDVTRSDIYGFCVPFAIELMKLREDSKIDVKIRLCDTLGMGIPYPGAALPRAVDKIVRAMIDDAGVPSHLLEWHGHNDFYKSLTNAVYSWLYGCSAVNGTLLGFGERTGNTPIEALVIEYVSLTGRDQDVDTTVITEIASYIESEGLFHIPANQPFVGADFNATAAGIHLDGLIKNKEVYTIFDTEKILKREIGIIINDKAGAAGVAHWINSHLKLKGGIKVDKRHPGISKILKWIHEQYESGRVTSISSKEMEKLARKYLPELFPSELEVLKEKTAKTVIELIEEIAKAKEVTSMDVEKMVPLLQKFVEENPFIQFAYVTDKFGKRITPNITQPDLIAKYDSFHFEDNFSNRSWFINPIRTGVTYVTSLYTSMITKALCFTVSTPIRGEDEEIIGIIGVDVRFEDIEKMEEEDLWETT